MQERRRYLFEGRKCKGEACGYGYFDYAQRQIEDIEFCPIFAAALGKRGLIPPGSIQGENENDSEDEFTRQNTDRMVATGNAHALLRGEGYPSQSACGDDSCPICHFSLEPFTPGESLTLSVTLSYTHHEPGTLREPLFGQPVASYNLRAPPAC